MKYGKCFLEMPKKEKGCAIHQNLVEFSLSTDRNLRILQTGSDLIYVQSMLSTCLTLLLIFIPRLCCSFTKDSKEKIVKQDLFLVAIFGALLVAKEMLNFARLMSRLALWV